MKTNRIKFKSHFYFEWLFYLFAILLYTGCVSNTTSNQPKNSMSNITLVIHGGAGNFSPHDLSEEEQAAYKATMEEALKSGFSILEQGGSSMDAVEKAIRILEDSPLFNAGKGSVLTNNEKAELDASLMDGATGKAGAVAGVTTIKNPISGARKVMEASPHVLMAGRGAEQFAADQKLEIVDPSYFITEKSLQQLRRIKEAEKKKSGEGSLNEMDKKMGTVGAVALDKNGNLTAGTSTGGMVNKKFGRVGDSPIIGAGTFASNTTCAVSCTGHGEFFIRNVVAYDVSALMEYKGWTLEKATNFVIQEKLTKTGGTGGLISVDKEGNIAMKQNTQSMFRGYMNAKESKVFIFR